jgi:peptidoglycan/LPS O-acetylase OafA/YrhL
MWGWVGVDLFFVLSGFLITGILYNSCVERKNYFRNFYMRRSLRIFPLYYGFFLLIFIARPFFHLEWPPSLIGFILYVGNLIVPFCNLQINNPTIIMQAIPGHLPQDFCNIGQLWSLCVEEQFYLLWPLVIYLVKDRRKLMYLSGGLTVAVLLVRSAVRIHIGAQPSVSPFLYYSSTYFRCDELLMGSFLALWLRGESLSLRSLRRISMALMVLPGGVFFAGLFWVQHIHPNVYLVIGSTFVTTIGFTLIGLACVGVLLRSLDDSSALSRILTLNVIGRLGAISYGIYFFHALPVVFLRRVVQSHPRISSYIPFLAFIAITTFAALSFRFYETPFLNLKTRFGSKEEQILASNAVV